MVMSTKLDIGSVIFIGVSSVSIQNMILRNKWRRWLSSDLELVPATRDVSLSHRNNAMQENSLFYPIHNRCLCFDNSWV